MFYTIQYIKMWLKNKHNIIMEEADIIHKYGRFIPLRLGISKLSIPEFESIMSNCAYSKDELDKIQEMKKLIKALANNEFSITRTACSIEMSKVTVRNRAYDIIKDFYPEYNNILQKHRARATKYRKSKDRIAKEKAVNGQTQVVFGTEDNINKPKRPVYIQINSTGESKNTHSNEKKKAKHKKAILKHVYGRVEYTPKNEAETTMIKKLFKTYGIRNIFVSASGEVWVRIRLMNRFTELIMHAGLDGKPYVDYRGSMRQVQAGSWNNQKVVEII